ncbi:hypothetical protein TNCT_394301 [Trichonephila clavata]|uniref:Uncharacterized protein n=1 Tax=Trichonephila clavata TaxID=2740835 RepID=A0A8X6FQI1_TRICU|nr:hypothetical protein TNCT_394301 [Trichonephila clavata]
MIWRRFSVSDIPPSFAEITTPTTHPGTAFQITKEKPLPPTRGCNAIGRRRFFQSTSKPLHFQATRIRAPTPLFLLSFPSEPTLVPYRANQRPSTLVIGISCGLDNILVQTHVELTSDHNPVQFVVLEANNMPYAQNCTTFTNWMLFQELVTISVPGNPKINSTSEIDDRIEQLTNNIHCALI